MKNYKSFICVIAVSVLMSVGYQFSDLKKYTENVEEPKKTFITKEVLRERLTARLVKMTEAPRTEPDSANLSANKKKVDIREDLSAPRKPNPLTLQIRFAAGNNSFLLNSEPKENFGALANTLRAVFREREANGIFIEGTNDIYKKITLPAQQKLIDEYNAKNITVEDFEKLVDDLRNENFGQIELDTNEENYVSIPDATKDVAANARRRLPTDSNAQTPKNLPKSISGGVINGKAINLVKPIYPPAAKSVRASGAVNVEVTIDENGNVISATAVSGHPLLRPTAEAAAKDSKFAPTMLSGQKVKVTGIIVFNFVAE